jgi:hypothetical protein
VRRALFGFQDVNLGRQQERGSNTLFRQSEMLRPVSCLPAGNMMLFDAEGKIRRYETPEQIVQEFFDLRLSFYAKRKAALLKVDAVLHLTPQQRPVGAQRKCRVVHGMYHK